MNFKQRRILFNAFIKSQFGYCPLVWMFHGRNANNKINNIHERALRIVYKDYTNSFEYLLKQEKSVTIHQRNLQTLAIELFKVKSNISNTILNNIFMTRNLNYNLRSQNNFIKPFVRTTKFGLNSLRAFASKVWDMVPSEIKVTNSLDEFKFNIRKWKPENCNCKLCQPFIENLGFATVI